ncbi:MAG: branched-chain amino acid ABC transporter permease, partial [Alicyclobacillaceae bacterium]|nr:branched-chain amino acid ABC transporter permease [Alicyclobacillaceae bacterium]
SYIWAIAGYGLNVILGYTGQLSLAHAGFFGIGAYAVALLTVKANLSFWPALIVGCVLSVLIAYVISLISFRTKGHYFAIFTLAVGVIINLVLEKWDRLTNGNMGIVNIPPPSAIGPLNFQSQTVQYYLVLGVLLFSIYLTYACCHSLVGWGMKAVRNSEALAQAVGISVIKTKRLAFLLSAFLAALAGGLYASYIGYLGPEISSPAIMFDMLLYLLVGGVGTLGGPIVGAIAVSTINQLLQTFQEYQMLILGPVLVLLVIYFPGGLVGMYHRFRRRQTAVSSQKPREPIRMLGLKKEMQG